MMFRKRRVVGLWQPNSSSPFSDNDWPTDANRPTISGSILTWVGPSGGGANNGNPVQQTTTLTTVAGATITTNQQGKFFNGASAIAANNLTIKQCVFYADDQTILQINDNVDGLIIEDCLWYGPGLSGSNNGGGQGIQIGSSIGTGNITIRRCNSHHAGQHPIQIAAGPTTGKTLTVSDTQIHDVEDNQPGVSHYDCIYYGGGATGTMVFQHNTIVQNLYTQTSGILLESFFGAVSHVTLNNNYIAGQNYNVEIRNKGAGALSNITMTNNHVGIVGQLNYTDIDAITSPVVSGNVSLITFTDPISNITYHPGDNIDVEF